MILAANAAVGVITETNAEKALEVSSLDLLEIICGLSCSNWFL